MGSHDQLPGIDIESKVRIYEISVYYAEPGSGQNTSCQQRAAETLLVVHASSPESCRTEHDTAD